MSNPVTLYVPPGRWESTRFDKHTHIGAFNPQDSLLVATYRPPLQNYTPGDTQRYAFATLGHITAEMLDEPTSLKPWLHWLQIEAAGSRGALLTNLESQSLGYLTYQLKNIADISHDVIDLRRDNNLVAHVQLDDVGTLVTDYLKYYKVGINDRIVQLGQQTTDLRPLHLRK